MGDFIGVLSKIKGASDAFDTGAKDFRAAVPDNLAGSAFDSGDGGLDSAITAVLAGIDTMHTWIAGMLTRTSGALLNAHDDYQRIDNETIRELYDVMLADNPVG